VTVWSKEGAGSTFTLQLPVQRKPPANGAGPAAGHSQLVREAVQ
jgi:hypothetical protein